MCLDQLPVHSKVMNSCDQPIKSDKKHLLLSSVNKEKLQNRLVTNSCSTVECQFEFKTQQLIYCSICVVLVLILIVFPVQVFADEFGRVGWILFSWKTHPRAFFMSYIRHLQMGAAQNFWSNSGIRTASFPYPYPPPHPTNQPTDGDFRQLPHTVPVPTILSLLPLMRIIKNVQLLQID